MDKVKIAVITASDKGAVGERVDLSGPLITKIVSELGAVVTSCQILSDDKTLLSKRMAEIADSYEVQLILTTGGTGCSKRDLMPEATQFVCERLVPGIPEAMRGLSMKYTGRAMLSRAQAGIRKETLIVNLPGSPKAIQEILPDIYPHLVHGVEILTGRAIDCACTDNIKKKVPIIIAFCGVKNSGKTTYLSKLIKRLMERSYRVAVIKHDGHDFIRDMEDTDSHRYKKAGAYGTAVFSERHFMIYKEQESISEMDLIQAFPESDIILLEGFKNSKYNKFEVIRQGISKIPASNQENLLGIITDIENFQWGEVKVIPFHDLDKTVKMITEQLK